MMPDAAWIRQGHAIYMAEGWVLHIKNEVSDTLQHGALTILKYLRVIMQLLRTSQALKVVLNDFPADFEIPPQKTSLIVLKFPYKMLQLSYRL